MKKNVFIFRHGETVWNKEGRPQGQHPYPVPLTMDGMEQAQKLAEKLKDKKIKLIISSDLLRAQQTAEIVGKCLNVPIKYDERLREINYGLLNGLYPIEREEIYPEYKKCYTDSFIPFPEGESRAQVAMRIKEVIKETCETVKHRTIAFSTHGHAMECFMLEVCNQAVYPVKNCSYGLVRYDPQTDNFELIEIPETSKQEKCYSA